MRNFFLKFRNLYEIIYDTIKGFIDDDAFTHAAAVSFFIILSIIPIIVLGVSILSGFGNQSEAYNWIFKQVNEFSPDIAYKYDIYLKNIIEDIITIRGKALGFGIISLIWIGMNTICSLENSINVVMKINSARNYILRRLISFLLILLISILLYGTTLISAIINTQIDNGILVLNLFKINVSDFIYWFTKISSYFVYFIAFYLIYLILPRVKMPNIAVFISSLLAAFTWAAAKWLFSWFVVNLSQYSKIYGSMAALMIFIIWIYFSVVIMIFYGEMVYAIKNRIKPII